jgi:uncharacterized protein YukE
MTTPNSGPPAFTTAYQNYYDQPSTSVMTINTADMLASSAQAQQVTKQVAAAVKQINNELANLKLSWTGHSATEATVFNNRWNDAMDMFFGTATGPGALGQLLDAVANAGHNYATVEGTLRDMFSQLADSLLASLSSPSAGGGPGTPTNETSPPITLTY